MGTIQYQNARGQRLSGGTTVIGNCGWKTAPLMIWKERECIQRAIESFVFSSVCGSVEDFEKKLRTSIKEKTEEPPTIGTCTHDLIECDLKRTELDRTKYSPEILSKAETAFLNYLSWRDNVHLKPIAVEPHLVSEVYKFGGTPDCIAFINNFPAVFDWKTGSIYEDYLMQIACYRVLWEENNPDMPLTGGFHLLRIDKENGSFTHYFWESLSIAWEAFLHCLGLHQLHKPLKALLG